jgi:hypothetical protein
LSFTCILILSYHLYLGLRSGFFTSGFTSKRLRIYFPLPLTITSLLWFEYHNNVWWNNNLRNF